MSYDSISIRTQKLPKTLINTVLAIIVAINLNAQSSVNETGFLLNDPTDTVKRDTLIFNLDVDISQQLLSLDTILQIAYSNSPNIKYEESMIKSKVHDYRYNRMLFFQGFSGFYNYAVGNQTMIITGSTPVDNSQLSNGYRAGINISLPFSTLFGQNQKNKTLRALVEAATHRRDQIELELRREILRVYVNMIEAQRKLAVRNEDAQSSFLSAQVAEIELAEGKINTTEYARVKNIYAIAQNNVEQERANFLRAFFDFETLVGVEMKYLKKKPATTTPAPTTPNKN